jgi:hypothetical protein
VVRRAASTLDLVVARGPGAPAGSGAARPERVESRPARMAGLIQERSVLFCLRLAWSRLRVVNEPGSPDRPSPADHRKVRNAARSEG